MKIQSQLYIFVLVLVVGLEIIIFYFAFGIVTNEIQRNIESRLETNTAIIISLITGFTKERIGNMIAISDPTHTLLTDDKITIEEKIERLRAIEKAYKVYSSFSLYDVSGNKLGDTRNILIGINESDEMFFKEAIKGKIYHDKTAVYSKSIKQDIIHISGPLVSADGEMIGVVVARYSLQNINSMLNINKVNFAGIRLDLVSADGKILFSNYINNNERIDLDTLPETGNATSMTYDGVKSILVVKKETPYLDFEGSNWTLIAHISEEKAFAEIRNITMLTFFS